MDPQKPRRIEKRVSKKLRLQNGIIQRLHGHYTEGIFPNFLGSGLEEENTFLILRTQSLCEVLWTNVYFGACEHDHPELEELAVPGVVSSKPPESNGIHHPRQCCFAFGSEKAML